LLRKAGVDASWTWDQTMRTIITDPLYKALNTLAEKKAAWQKVITSNQLFLRLGAFADAGVFFSQYTDGLKAKEQEEKEARLAKLRPSIRNLLKGNPNVNHYTTFPTADKLFAQHPIWQQAKIESERRLIFEEHVSELKQREMVCPFSIDIVRLPDSPAPLCRFHSKRAEHRALEASENL